MWFGAEWLAARVILFSTDRLRAVPIHSSKLATGRLRARVVKFRMFRRNVIHAHELSDHADTKQELEKAIEDGVLVKVHRHWFASSDAPTDVVVALRNGMRLTCVSAAKYHGLYTPLTKRLHVYSVHGRSESSITSSHVPHPIPYLNRWPDENPIAPLDLTLLHAGRCLPIAEAAILFESAVNLGKILMDDALAIIDELPKRISGPLSRIRSGSESGSETMVRWFLESLRVKVQHQVTIPGVGRVDLIVGDSLAIECDAVTYHTNTDQYYKDRQRDAELIKLGYQPVHLTWEAVFLDWEETQQMLTALVRSRRHRYLRPIYR